MTTNNSEVSKKDNELSFEEVKTTQKSTHIIAAEDCLRFLNEVPDNSIDLVLLDPPYNIDIAEWDNFDNYIEWAAKWISESERVLKKTGNLIIFGGIQFDNSNSGDLHELMHFIRHNTSMKLVNLIIWYYKNGISAQRFFSNRHEEISWYVKSNRYTFNLDDVRIPYDEKTKELYLKDKRLNPDTVARGKNPTNVWEINRLNGNSKERVGHPTQKPVEIITRLVLALSNPEDTVLDFFAGSGTTTRVCIEQNRHSIAVDSNPMLFDYLESHLENMGSLLYDFELIKEKYRYQYHPAFKSN